MDHIPGSYPLDTPVATPQATLQPEPNMYAESQAQPQTQAPQHHGIPGHHDHHERNKLRKPDDQRSQQPADPPVGFGLTSSNPIQPTSKPEEPRTIPLLEAVAASAQARRLPPSEKFDDIRAVESDSPPIQPNAEYTYARPGGDATDDELPPAQKEAVENASTKKGSDEHSQPYWGSLPKAAGGGIYNTVMGHGSPNDDHAQQHHLSQRSAERVHIAGHTTDYPRGGVYNTVAGHGSQDEESKRHEESGRHGSASDSFYTSPLPGIEEGKRSEFAPTETGTGKSDFALDAESYAMDDAMLADSSLTQDPAVRQSRTIASSSSAAETGPRAFPLVPDHDKSEAQHDNLDDGHYLPEAEHRTSDDTLLAAATAGVAAGAGTGAGIAASEKEKPKKLQKRQGSPSEESRGRSEDDRATGTTNSFPHRPKDEKDTIRSKSKSDEGSPHGKRHSILGIFHRRKGSKDEASEHKKDDNDHLNRHRKEEAATATAAGAGAYGILHHHNEKDAKDQRSSSEPTRPQQDHPRSNQRTPHADSGGALGVLHQKSETKRVDNVQHGRASEPTAPMLPTKSEKRRSYSPRSSAALVEEAQSQAPGWAANRGSRDTQDEPMGNDSSHSGNNAMQYAAAGATAGIGASLFAQDHRQSADANTGAPVFEHPREPPSAPSSPSHAESSNIDHRTTPSPKTVQFRQSEEVTVKPGDYPTLPSGTASGVNNRASVPNTGFRESGTDQFTSGAMSSHKSLPMVGSRGGASHAAEEYNDLGSGKASGVRTVSASEPAERHANSSALATSKTPESTEEEYNVLPSGTPSGVKVKPTSHHTSYPEGSDDHSHASYGGDGQYNTLASGTSSGIGAAQTRETPRQPENEVQSARYTLAAAPMPTSPHLGNESPQLAASEDSRSTSYPSSKQAKQMSPEVLPDSYRAQSHSIPSASNTTSSAPSKASTNSSDHSQEHKTQSRTTNPALAAASGAWAAAAGPSSGVADHHAKIVHKCEHCGNENDITSDFTQENMAKLSGKSNSTGSSWYNSWTH